MGECDAKTKVVLGQEKLLLKQAKWGHARRKSGW